jgi:putative membrane protein
MLMAQTPANPPANPNAPDNTQASKTTDSEAEQSHNTGTPTDAGTLQRNDTKSGNSMSNTNSLDTNPSMAPTGSADKSATKDPSEAKSSGKKGMASDRMFIRKAAQGGMTEVELGKLAGEKGSASNVKEFGAHMVTDHGAANDKLKAIVEKKGMTVSSSLDAKHQAMVDKLSKLSGTAFDKAYVDAMVTAHENDEALFEKEADGTSDPDLKAFATDTLQVVKSHLEMIKNIQSGK